MRLLDGRHQRRPHLRHFSLLTLPRCQSCSGEIPKLGIQLTSRDSLFFHMQGVFVGPESDHWRCLSVTPSLTESLLFSKLD